MKTIADVGSFCEYARGILNELETKISDEYSRLELELDRSEADLAAASAKVCSLSAELEKKRAELITNQALLAVQESTMRSLEAQISDTRTEIENVRRKIHAEEQRRSNALYDLIPFHGLFAGIISGDMKRAIPLYSQIDGLISALTEDLADAEKREREIQAEINVLQQNLNESKSAVETAKQRVTELEADIVKNNQQVIDIDIRSKDIGQKISAIHDARAILEALKEKYDFLQSDVHEVMDLKDDALIDRCITDFLHLQSASE